MDRYGRTVATCSVDGVDLGDWLVHSGLALDWPRYSKRKHDAAQRDAEHAGRGMWAGSYVEPWQYRACVRQGGRPGDCRTMPMRVHRAEMPCIHRRSNQWQRQLPHRPA
jgi:hypothetical protein